MAEFARVATFVADDASIDALVSRIESEGGAPSGVPATRSIVLADRSAGKVLVVLRFASEDDLKNGSEVLEGMSPSESDNIRRVSVDVYEVELERALP